MVATPGVRIVVASSVSTIEHFDAVQPLVTRFDNRLQQDFTADRPNQKWVGDITYVWTSAGWLYLAVVMDIYSRLIIRWAISERMTATLVTDGALQSKATAFDYAELSPAAFEAGLSM